MPGSYTPERSQELLMSRPVPVSFQGFKSTTAELYQNGWSIAVSYDVDRYWHRIMLAHETLELCGISDAHRFRHIDPFQYSRNMGEDPREVVHINQIGHSKSIHHTQVMVQKATLSDFREVDACPEIMQHRIDSVEDLCIFKWKDKQQVDEIIVQKADMSVIEHLEAIKAMQQPKQKELRSRMGNNEIQKSGEVVQLLQVA